MPLSGKIREVLEAKHGRILKRLLIQQNAIRYHDMVNALRDRCPPRSTSAWDACATWPRAPCRQRVPLGWGSVLACRLVVLASGTAAQLASRVGPSRRSIQSEQSVSFGFDAGPLRRKGVSVRLGHLLPRRARVGGRLPHALPDRQRHARESLHVLAAARHHRLHPGTRVATRLRIAQDHSHSSEYVVSRVVSARVDLFRQEPSPQAGLVPIGTMPFRACARAPAPVSARCSPTPTCSATRWRPNGSRPPARRRQVARWYEHSRKRCVDPLSLSGAAYRRRVSLDGSLQWRAHRARVYSSMRLEERSGSFSVEQQARSVYESPLAIAAQSWSRLRLRHADARLSQLAAPAIRPDPGGRRPPVWPHGWVSSGCSNGCLDAPAC